MPGGDPEPEPTAMLAVALDDGRARSWLARVQGPDGSVGIKVGDVFRDDTSLAALASVGAARERALDHLESTRAAFVASSTSIPYDDRFRGWPWTEHDFGWVEPTAWATIALRASRPTSPRVADGLGMLADRECTGGGWNYGNRTAFGVDLPPFGQTTALGLIAVQGAHDGLASRAASRLAALVEEERDGLLTVATAVVAFRVAGDRRTDIADRLLPSALPRDLATVDTVALAWTALAFGSRPLNEVFGR
jgi:hypothetical protein